MEKNTSHYSNVTVSDMAPQTTGASIVVQAYIKETSKLRDTGRCDGNPPVTEWFPSQKANNTENVPLDDLIIITYLHNSLGKGVLWWAVCPCVARDVHLMPRTHFRTRPGSSSELAQIIFLVCPGSHSMLPQDPLPTSKNPSGWIICILTDMLPSNNMLQTLVSQDQLRLQDWLRTYPYNSLSIYRECRLMVIPHEVPFRSHWNKNVGIFNCTRGCQNDNAWCESTDEQVVTLMTFSFQWA